MASDDSMDRVIQSGSAFFAKGGGFTPDSRAKSKNGDESQAMAALMGNGTGSWARKLDDGAASVYPDTPEALKTKNSRRNNDSFTG